MTFLEAAEKVLAKIGHPMKVEDIVNVAMREGWLSSDGKTPSATMRAQLGTHVNKLGKVFRRVKPGIYGLLSADKQIAPAAEEDMNSPGTDVMSGKSGRKVKPIGCVYILANPSFKSDWLKIGQTSDPEPWARMKELYLTPVPLPFRCVAYMQTRRFVEAEKHIHSFIDRFTRKRISEKREFFRMDQQQAIDTLRDVAAMVHGVVHVGPFDVDDDSGKVTAPSVENNDNEWRTSRNGIKAKGRYFADRFEVLAGSQINMAKSTGFAAGDKLREKLKAEGLVIEKRPGVFVLKCKQSFTTPSAASCFVLGGATNGWYEWKNVNGEPLDVMRKNRGARNGE